jgi:hypothetical protein
MGFQTPLHFGNVLLNLMGSNADFVENVKTRYARQTLDTRL